MYPVGSCYFSTVSTSPATVIGGTWAAMTGGMLGLAGSTGVAGAAGNGGSRKISVNQMPSHSHYVKGWNIGKTAAIASTTPYNWIGYKNSEWQSEAGMITSEGGVRTLFPHTPLFTVGEEPLSKVGEC